MYDIEMTAPLIGERCSCCGTRNVRLVRYLTRDDEARGVYSAGYVNLHADQGAWIRLSLGPWWDGTNPDQRSCFSFRFFPYEEGHSIGFCDPSELPGTPYPKMGKLLSRDEALEHPLKQEVFDLSNQIAGEDPSIRGFLERTRCGEASVPLEHRFGLPDLIFAMPEDERRERVRSSNDFAILDASRFFLRSLVTVPVEGYGDWNIGAWSEVAEEDFQRFYDAWDVEEEYGGLRCSGTLANDLAEANLVDCHGAEVEIGVRSVDAPPFVLSSSSGVLQKYLDETWPQDDFVEYAIGKGFL